MAIINLEDTSIHTHIAESSSQEYVIYTKMGKKMKPNCTHSVTKAEVDVSFKKEISQWGFFVAVVCVLYMCSQIFWEGPSQRQAGWDGPSICDVCCADFEARSYTNSDGLRPLITVSQE